MIVYVLEQLRMSVPVDRCNICERLRINPTIRPTKVVATTTTTNCSSLRIHQATAWPLL